MDTTFPTPALRRKYHRQDNKAVQLLSITAAHGQFNGIRQVAPVCTTTIASLGPPESKFQTGSRSVQPFLHSSLQSAAILYNGPPLHRLQNCHSLGGIWTPTRSSLGPPESSTQIASQSVQPFLQGSLL